MIFLPVVALLYWRTTGSARLLLVIFSSYFFYMSWLPVYGIFLFAMTVINWLLGLAIEKVSKSFASPSECIYARVLFALGLFLNLGCLFYYKYTNFVLTNIGTAVNFVTSSLFKVHVLSTSPPVWQAPVLDIILPLGISFFVFEFVHYLVDVYRGDRPVKSFLDFTAFASFFPSQIAGPIKRYQDFTQKLRSPEPFGGALFIEGMTLIVRGLFKKVAIADPIGAIIYSPFTTLAPLSSADAMIASVGFVIQVYCDFSGYTDIGRGSALLMGIRLPENFQLPYLAADLAEFWRRWHMSLSFWLRDYLYIPLGGSKRGTLANWRNLVITMVVCGLWHGAGWHYVVFGLFHGVGLIVNRIWRQFLEKSSGIRRVVEQTPFIWLGNLATMLFVTISYVIFRAPDMSHAFNILGSYMNVHMPLTLAEQIEKSGTLHVVAIYLMFWLGSEVLSKNQKLMSNLRPIGIANSSLQFAVPVRLASWTVALIMLVAARPTSAVPFVYFQF